MVKFLFVPATGLTASLQHVKCDETRPRCTKCTDKSISCPGYSKSLIWKPTLHADVRRPASKKRKTSSHASSTPTRVGGIDVSAQASTSQISDSTCRLERTQRSCEQDSGTLSWEVQAVQSFDDGHAQQQEGSAPSLEGIADETVGSLSGDSYEDFDDIFDPNIIAASASNAPSMSNDASGLEMPDLAGHLSLNIADAGPSQPADVASWASDHVLDELAWGSEIDSLDFRSLGADTGFDETSDSHHNSSELPGFTACSPGSSRALSAMPDLDKQRLTVHYFETVCRILSCFDSHENPFRSDVPRVMLTCGYMNDCVIGMSAAHLANSSIGMESVALQHQVRAMSGLSAVIKSLRGPSLGHDAIVSRRDSFTRSARHQALLTAMLLGISSVSA